MYLGEIFYLDARIKRIKELRNIKVQIGNDVEFDNFDEPEELVGKTLLAITNLPPRAMMGIESCGMLLSAIHDEEGEEKLNLIMLSNRIPAGAKLY